MTVERADKRQHFDNQVRLHPRTVIGHRFRVPRTVSLTLRSFTCCDLVETRRHPQGLFTTKHLSGACGAGNISGGNLSTVRATRGGRCSQGLCTFQTASQVRLPILLAVCRAPRAGLVKLHPGRSGLPGARPFKLGHPRIDASLGHKTPPLRGDSGNGPSGRRCTPALVSSSAARSPGAAVFEADTLP